MHVETASGMLRLPQAVVAFHASAMYAIHAKPGIDVNSKAMYLQKANIAL